MKSFDINLLARFFIDDPDAMHRRQFSAPPPPPPPPEHIVVEDRAGVLAALDAFEWGWILRMPCT